MLEKLSNVFIISKKKGIVGAVLAVLALIAGCVFISPAEGILFAVLFAAVGFFKIKTENHAAKYALTLAWAVIPTVMSFFFYLSVTTFVYDVNIPTKRLIINALIVLVLLFLIFAISGKPRSSVSVSAVFFLILSSANVYVYRFRGKELVPTDIFSLGTAMSVAGGYDFTPSPEMTRIFLITALLIFIGFSLPTLKFKTLKENITLRALSAVTAIASVFLVLNHSQNIPIKTWETEGSRINGYYLNFVIALRDARPDKPEGYSKDALAALEAEYSDTSPDSQNAPNVIVIMNESFADLSVIGELKTNIPVTPFLDSLSENTVKGYALTSVFGGNTANAEFEFLTGHSMAFAPTDSVPYQQFINGDMYSLARHMSALGYKSFATHPYYANGWSRNVVYPHLGFDEYTFIEDYTDADTLRTYVSDRGMYEYVLKKIDDETAPLFTFGITMQNHSGYDYSGDDFEKRITLDGYSGSYPQAEQYLTLLNESDSALEYLISEIEKSHEDTVVLFFGDHLPRIEDSFYEELYGGSFDTPEARALKYTVPFFIWANFDIEEKTVPLTSINYLANHLLSAAGLGGSAYYSFMSDAEAVIPALNAFGYYSDDGSFNNYDVSNEILKKHAILQYNNMFDSKNRSEVFYGTIN